MTSGKINQKMIFFTQNRYVRRPNIEALAGENEFSAPTMHTPNLDNLAAKSMVLTNAYVQVVASL